MGRGCSGVDSFGMYMSSFYWSLPVTGGFYRMPIFRGFGFGYALGIGSY